MPGSSKDSVKSVPIPERWPRPRSRWSPPGSCWRNQNVGHPGEPVLPDAISACGISGGTIEWGDIIRRVRTGESNVTDKLDRWADPPLLVLASLAGEPKHGYAITQDVAETMGVRLSAGTLYAVIARLEARGLIEPLESDDRRRPYRITMAGAKALAQQSERMSKVASVARERLSTSLGWVGA